MTDFDKYRNTLRHPGKALRDELWQQHKERIDNTPLTAKDRAAAVSEAEKAVDEAIKAAKDAYAAESELLDELFWHDFDTENGADILPADIKAKLHSYVYAEWHSGGYHEMWNCGGDITELVVEAYKACKC